MLLPQLEDPARGVGGFDADVGNTTQEEREPALEVAGVPCGLEPLVVLLTMTLEVVRQVENGLPQRATLTEQEGDEEPPDTAVAIEKRMDGLELRVRQANLRE